MYDLEVFDYSVNNWIVLEEAFEVFPELEIMSVDPQTLIEGETSTILIFHNDAIDLSNISNISLSKEGNTIQSNNLDLYAGAGIWEVEFSPEIGVNLGNWDLVINHVTFGEISFVGYVTIEPSPAIINFITPTFSAIGETISVTISGHNTNFNDVSGTTNFFQSSDNTIYPTYTNVLADNVIIGSITIPNSEEYFHSYDLLVNDPVNGDLILENALDVGDFGEYSLDLYGWNYSVTISDIDGVFINNYSSNYWNDSQTHQIILNNNECYSIEFASGDYVQAQLNFNNNQIFSENYAKNKLRDV